MIKFCSKCGVKTDDSNTYKQNDRKSRMCYCKKCFSQYCINRWKKRKERCVTQFGGKCSKCGYKKYIGALEFHHIDKTQKTFGWNKMRQVSEEKLQKELRNCILICSNCHRELEEELRNF